MLTEGELLEPRKKYIILGAIHVTVCCLDYCASGSVSDYVQMDVFTSAKSTQYVEILGQGRKQMSRIPGVTS